MIDLRGISVGSDYSDLILVMNIIVIVICVTSTLSPTQHDGVKQ